MSVVFRDKLLCRWVKGVPTNEGEKDGQTQVWPIDQTLQCSLGGAMQLTRYAVPMYMLYVAVKLKKVSK